MMDYEITKAVQHDGYVLLDLTSAEETIPYVLYPDDPYGAAPALREQLAGMVERGEIIIEQPETIQ
jgi:hypothetical protein